MVVTWFIFLFPFFWNFFEKKWPLLKRCFSATKSIINLFFSFVSFVALLIILLKKHEGFFGNIPGKFAPTSRSRIESSINRKIRGRGLELWQKRCDWRTLQVCLAHIVLDERINFPLDNPTFIEGSYLESIPRSPLRKGFLRVVPSNGKMLQRNPFGSCCPNPERQNFPWPQRTCEP